MKSNKRRLNFITFQWKYYIFPAKFDNVDKDITVQDEIRMRKNGEPASKVFAGFELADLENLRLKISVVSRKVTYEKKLVQEDWEILDKYTASFIRHYRKHSKKKPWF